MAFCMPSGRVVMPYCCSVQGSIPIPSGLYFYIYALHSRAGRTPHWRRQSHPRLSAVTTTLKHGAVPSPPSKLTHGRQAMQQHARLGFQPFSAPVYLEYLPQFAKPRVPSLCGVVLRISLCMPANAARILPPHSRNCGTLLFMPAPASAAKLIELRRATTHWDTHLSASVPVRGANLMQP